jgi:hypothetical protein
MQGCGSRKDPNSLECWIQIRIKALKVPYNNLKLSFHNIRQLKNLMESIGILAMDSSLDRETMMTRDPLTYIGVIPVYGCREGP